MEKKRHKLFWKDFGWAQSPTIVLDSNHMEIHTVFPGVILYFYFENCQQMKSQNQSRSRGSSNQPSDLLPEETGKVNKGAIFNKLVQHEMNVPDKKEI